MYQIVQDNLETALDLWRNGDTNDPHAPPPGPFRDEVEETARHFLQCGVLRFGAVKIQCPDCRKTFFVAFSCGRRGLCVSCAQKRALLRAEHLDSIAPRVPHRQFVLTIPKRLRAFFRNDPRRCGKLLTFFGQTLRQWFERRSAPDALPGASMVLQLFGNDLKVHPHIHAIVSDGAFLPDGTFLPLQTITETDRECFEQDFRDRLLRWCIQENLLDKVQADNMRSWPHSGFSLDTSVKTEADDQAGLRRIALYIHRPPLVASRLTYKRATGMVVYKLFRNERTHFHARSNFLVMPATQFLLRLLQLIPPPGLKTTRYIGVYAPARSGVFKPSAPNDGPDENSHDETENNRTTRSSWARLIHRVFEVDPLTCPECGTQMRIVAAIVADAELVRILTHLDLPFELPKTAPSRASPPQVQHELSYHMDEDGTYIG